MITKEQKKIDMMNDFLNVLELEIEEADKAHVPFGDWPVTEKILLDGRQFSFKKHEYLIEPYHDTHPYQVEIKATQLGLTSKALLRVIYGCRYETYRGILYLFPSRTDVTDLSKTRLTPLIEENPDTIGRWIRDTDSANVKKIWNSFLYLRGMKSRIGIKCHDEQTEVLTKSGWKLFQDTTMEDEFATRSPSGRFMWQFPIAIHQYINQDTMLHFTATGLDLCVTPNHRLLLTSTNRSDEEWFDTADRAKRRGHEAIVRTCKYWKGYFPDFIITDGRSEDGAKKFIQIKGNKKNSAWESFGREDNRNINLKDFMAFLGLYISEGSCSGVKNGKRTGGRISISQVSHSKHCNDIKHLLAKINPSFRYDGKNFRVGDMGLADIVFPLGNKYTKTLPEWVLNLPVKYLEILWEWALKGDGHVTPEGYRNYATVSPKLAGQLQEILQKCGRSASILKQKPSRIPQLKDGRLVKATTVCYLVSERRSKCSVVPIPKEIPYNGMVYCASVPNGTLYTRRNGYAIWSGNSIPVDFEVFDELDEAPQNAVDMALERMAHSDTGDLLFLSNPTLPDFGIDKLFCVSPDTKILTSDLVHVNASSLKIGDELIGFDENKLPENKTRCYRRTKVVALKKVFLPSVRITLENGTSVVCSKQHRWLNSIGGNTRFKIAKHFKVGDNMIYIGTWDVDNTRDGGWLSGIFDGEGSVGCSKKDERRGTATYVSFTQNEGFVLRNTTKLLDKFGFSYHIHEAHKEGYGSCYNIKLKGGLPERLRFIGTFRPCRLLPKSSILWEGRSVGNDAGATKRILIEKIEDIGTVELIAIETEHKTYIANGLLSHNSDTDQQFFLLKCSKCNEYTDLVETFPNCLQRVRGRVIRACQKCGAELDPSVGKWVAKRPSITERRGRQYSQLYSQTKTTTPELILHKFETTDNMTDFYNLKIGLAYVDAANRLSVQEVLACCGDNGMMTESSQGCFMGVDQGANLHVVIGRHHKSRAGEIIWAGILKGNNENDKTDESGWLELDALMNRFKVMRCVVDAMPNTKLARNFSDRFRGRVFLCYYNEHQKGSYRWNEKDMIVQANRTESLDASHREITTNNIVIPRRSDLIQKFAEQMHNVAKRLEVDDETGSQKYVYHRLGADHFRHAFNYESMARRSSPELLFPEML